MTTRIYPAPLALLPLRGGSKGIPGKNIRPFLGRPLFSWCASAAIDAGLKLCVSTEDHLIREAVLLHTPKAEIIKRPAHLSSDHASTEAVIDHALSHIDCEHILLLQATSPLTTRKNIQEAIIMYHKNDCRPLISGTRQHSFCWSDDGIPFNYSPISRPRRQDWPGTFKENGAFYIFSRASFLDSSCRCPPPCTLFEMDSHHSIELDTVEDWLKLEAIARNLSF